MRPHRKKLTIGIATDAFKGTLTALEVADGIEAGLKQTLSGFRVRKIPMADGGEGTARTIVEASHGRLVTRRVTGPLGEPVRATFGLSGDGRTAVIEMAEASGLGLVPPDRRHPLHTTTRGTGELMAAALKLGARKLVIGIGGSATNDGGMGMARALGVRFLNAQGENLAEGGGALGELERIDMSGLDPRLAKATVEVACDVDNPLTGKHGAAAVYGPQKGATPEMVKILDAGLRTLARVVKRDTGHAMLKVPGAGAAGGLGGGLMAFAGGDLRPGVDIVMEAVQLKRKLKGCDLVITGEGRMDGQTVNGKTPSGVARVARALGLPVIAIAGCLGHDVERVRAIGIQAWFATQKHNLSDEEIAKAGPPDLEECAAQIGALLAIGLQLPGTAAHPR